MDTQVLVSYDGVLAPLCWKTEPMTEGLLIGQAKAYNHRADGRADVQMTPAGKRDGNMVWFCHVCYAEYHEPLSEFEARRGQTQLFRP